MAGTGMWRPACNEREALPWPPLTPPLLGEKMPPPCSRSRS